MRDRSPLQTSSFTGLSRKVLLASLAGGTAELVWIGLYAAFTPLSSAAVAREITASLLPMLASGVAGVWLGVAIHLMLSLAVGFVFVSALWRPYLQTRGPVMTLAASVLALAGIWSMNFFVLLPALNPAFAALMPYPVTFASKIMFAVAMAMTLVWSELVQPDHHGSRNEGVAH